MADEKKPGAAVELLSKHGEKIILAAAVLGLVAYVVLGVVMANPDPGSKPLLAQIKLIIDEKGEDHSDEPSMKAGKPDTYGEVLAPQKTMTLAAEASDGVATLATTIIYHAKKGPVIIINPVKVPEISFDSSSVELDKVEVSWTAESWTSSERSQLKKGHDLLNLTHFTIERKVGEGKWKVVQSDVPITQNNYVDTDIDPKTTYHYRITSHCEEDLKKRAGASGMTIQTPMPLTTLGIWSLSINTAMKGQAYLTIQKFDKKLGRKVEKKHIHHAKDRIGWWKETGGDVPVSTHLVPLGGGKSASVDFNTGMTLVSVEKKPATIKIDKCDPIYGPGGQRTGCTRTTEDVTISNTYEVVYKDKDGKHVLFYPDPMKNPRARSKACADHGGPDRRKKKPGAQGKLEKGSGSAAPGNLPANLAAKRAREKAAEAIFVRAEGFAKANPSRAIKDFERLLEDYGDTDFVSKKKLIVIQTRIAALSDD